MFRPRAELPCLPTFCHQGGWLLLLECAQMTLNWKMTARQNRFLTGARSSTLNNGVRRTERSRNSAAGQRIVSVMKNDYRQRWQPPLLFAWNAAVFAYRYTRLRAIIRLADYFLLAWTFLYNCPTNIFFLQIIFNCIL